MDDVAKSADTQRTLLIPSAQPPHKPRQLDMAPATDRLTMCRIAAAQLPDVEVCDIELLRDGPSYTYDTVKALKASGECLIKWLIGADMLMMLPKWYRAADLLNEVEFLVMARPGTPIDWSALPPEYRRLEQNVVPAPFMDVSATEIRERVRTGLSIDHLVPAGVAQYIAEHGLYR